MCRDGELRNCELELCSSTIACLRRRGEKQAMLFVCSLRFIYFLLGVGSPVVKEFPLCYCLFPMPQRDSRLLYILTSVTMGGLRNCQLGCVMRRQQERRYHLCFHIALIISYSERGPLQLKDFLPCHCLSRVTREKGRMSYIINKLKRLGKGQITQPNIFLSLSRR